MNQKVILITGASSGIGHASAAQLLQDGHIVYCAARRIERMSDLEAKGGRCIQCDVTNEADLKNTVERIIKEKGHIDVLFNNAGYGPYGPVEDIPITEAKRQYDVNLFAVARLTQLVLPHMRAQKSGLIINTSSMGGKMYTALGAWYHSTKHALEGWSDCLRVELKQFGIAVVLLEPGVIRTEFGDVVGPALKERQGSGAYVDIINAMRRTLANAYDHKHGSPPELIAKTVLTIVNSKRPKTRYLVGKNARLFVFARRFLGDRIFDWLLLRQLKL